MDKPRFADALTIDQLEIFVEVADIRSFSGAAKRLRRAQSAVSYGIARLETLLGVRLFERSRRESRVTRAGQILLAEARQILERVDHFRAAGIAFGEKVEPELALSVSPILAVNALAEATREYAAHVQFWDAPKRGGNAHTCKSTVSSRIRRSGFSAATSAPR